jgi:hypothetical protein
LDQAGTVITGGQDEYIKSGEPKSTYGKIQQATARQACRRYADNPSNFSGVGAVLVEKACRPYLDDIGYGGAPSLKLPYRGGQCSALYKITFNYDMPSMPGLTGELNDRLGPLGAVAGNNNSFGGAFLSPGFSFENWTIQTASGSVLMFGSSGGSRLNSLSVQRMDMAPDTCGNLPPVVVGPTPPVSPGPPREPFTIAPDIDIDIGVDINPDGTIDVDFGTGPINIDPFGEDEPNGGGLSDLDPGDIGEEGEPEDTGDDGEAAGCAPEGSVLGGISIAITSTPPRPNKFTEEVFRGVGFVYMGVPDNLALHPEGSTMKNNQFFFPYKNNLTCWLVRANVGYTLQVTPYYISGEEE